MASRKHDHPSIVDDLSPSMYPQHRVVVDDDDDGGGGGEQITPPIVSAAFASTPADEREQKVRVIERRAAAAEARRQAAERRLAEDRQTLRQRLANLSKIQRVGVGLVALGLIIMVATAALVLAICHSGACRYRPTSTPTGATTKCSAASSCETLSPRAQSIWDYINNITLVTGRTLLYPDDAETTAEGRALSWLIAEQDELDDRPISDGERTGLRQRYALATLWFQTPTHFASPRVSTNLTWATAINECDWYGVNCSSSGTNNNRVVVSSLQLEQIGVQGRIPDDLALLTALTEIDFTSNQPINWWVPFHRRC
jgi:hypothetical protein